MKYYKNILEAIGNTPLVKLNQVIDQNHAMVLAKLEYLNPLGSVKERMALHVICQAEKEGKIKKGDIIVDNTSGNTGIGIALVATLKGYKCLFAVSSKQSQEKVDMLKALGAEVIITPADAPHDSPESCYNTAKRIAGERKDAFYLNQNDNPQNTQAHYLTTGPEIWEQTDGKVDCVVAGIGTGGTLSGIGRFLKEKNKDIKIIAIDPIGSLFYDIIKNDKMIEPKMYMIEGIGSEAITQALDRKVLDDILQVSDKEAFLMSRRLLKEEGLFVGSSSGAAVVGAKKMAEKLGKNKLIVTLLPDTGSRYLSKIYSDKWMKEHGFLD